MTMRFLRRYINLTTTGPYTLYIEPDRIIVELPKLENYLRIVCSLPVGDKSGSALIWQEGEQNFRDSDLLSSHRLFEAFTRVVKPSDPDFHSQLAVACLRLAEIEYQGEFGDRNIAYLFARAMEHATQISDRRKRELFIAYIIGMRAFASYPKHQTAARIAKLDQESINLADKLPDSADKLCLLGGRHYHLYYLALRYGMQEACKDELKASMQCFKQVELMGQPKWVHYENGIIPGVQLQSTLIRKNRHSDAVGDDDLDNYRQLKNRGDTSRIIILSCAEWLRKVMIKNRQVEQAVAFSAQSLLENTLLHETSLFRRILADNNRLKESVK